MRIVAGTFRGRPLVAPKGQSTRPTTDRRRQAMFNVLQHAAWSPGVDGLRVIDVFAGSGALGLEAISQGAGFCVFVENAEAARAAIRQNVESLGLTDRIRIDRRDAVTLGPCSPNEPPFDLAFVDPPYAKGLGEPALARLVAGGWLAAGALVALEHGVAEPGFTPPGFEALDQRSWGAGRVTFLRPLPALA